MWSLGGRRSRHVAALPALAERATHPILRAMKLMDELLFASDAELAALVGIASIMVASVCLAMERRQTKLARIDRVGWVPWTGLFLMFAILGGGLIALGLPVWLRG